VTDAGIPTAFSLKDRRVSFPKTRPKRAGFSQTIEICVLWINKKIFFACKNRTHVVVVNVSYQPKKVLFGECCGDTGSVFDQTEVNWIY